ncbi:FUSC family protein [Micromonospora sp. NPDC006766]|uniref:FUSC family protein n=1 Tax=Micromonospora sp. NPDC006766 TaxID=3154778 RepID=UPI0033DD038E
MALISIQAGLAAALSWVIARDLLHNPSPVFAPSAAVGTIVSAIGQRGRRTAETMLGVGLGIVVGDAVLLKIGYGPWQVGFVVAVALLAAFVLVGRSGALVAQAGGTAVLLATLAPVTPNLEWPRIVQASVGGLVGLAVWCTRRRRGTHGRTGKAAAAHPRRADRRRIQPNYPLAGRPCGPVWSHQPRERE